MKRFTSPLHRLQGKLTLSYTLTSVVAFLFIEVIVIGTILGLISQNIPAILVSNIKQDASLASPYFVHGAPDRDALNAWLHIINANLLTQGAFNQTPPIFLNVVDTNGQVIASVGSHPTPPNTLIQDQLSSQSRANLHSVLADPKGATSQVNAEANNVLVAITPIVGNGNVVRGALVVKMVQPDRLRLLTAFLQLILFSVFIVTTIAALAGMVFGYLTARSITRRLKELSTAADRWSRGNFSSLIYDSAEDELGQVARQLNRMAEQWQNLLQVRQKLATLEERNRLARDLHDSVKQQIFAVAMQLGATKLLLKRDVAAAEARLQETEKLVRQAQQELTSLIRELRPVALEGKGLAAALRELAAQWTEQTTIVANVRVEEAQALSLTVEEALFRVAQEALANVARHSNATLVQLQLSTTEQTVTLSIVDNGQGFAAADQQPRSGIGLLSMQERMKALGGNVQVESTPGEGTRIVASCQRSGVDADGATTMEVHKQEEPHSE